MQRTATPCTPVRFRPEPPFFLFVLTFPFPDMMLESSGYAGEIDSPIHGLAASRC